MAATVKLGVEYSQFKQGMRDAQESVKTLTEKLKQNESQLQLTGDKELYLKNKVDLLNQQIEAQKKVVENAKNALDQMVSGGVDKASAQYQKMEQNVYKASDQLNKMEIELRDVETGADKAGNEAQQMNSELKNVGKGVAWDNVTKGLDSIIGKLEGGARAAVNFGKKVISSAKGSTGWADDLITLSKQYGIDTTRLQQMQKVSEFVDTEVDAILTAQQRMKVATQSDKGVEAIEDVLGISLEGKTADDLFWEIGDSLVNMGEAFDKEAAAQKVFGRSWKELMPLFLTGREEYEKMLGEQNTLTDEQVQKLGEADDAIKKVEQQVQDLKNTFWAENADKITGLMQWFVDNKDAVTDALKAIGIAFGGLKLASLALNLAKVVNGFKELGLAGGKAAAEAGGTAASGGASIGGSAIAGIGGVAAIAAGFDWAKTMRTQHADQVRGTNEYLAANANAELISYLQAEKAKSALTWTESEAEIAAIVAAVDSSRARLMGTQGGQEALDAYSAWRQENSYGNNYWEVPEYLDKMVTVAGETTDAVTQSTAATELMTSAVKGFETMPELLRAAVESAVRSGMSGVTIVINESAVDAMVPRIGRNMRNQAVNMLR